MVKDFIFDGQALSDFGYVLIREDEEEIVVSNMTFETIKGARTDASQQIGYSYGEPYSTTFTIMKNFCEYEGDEQFMTRDDISEMVRWLCKKQYKWFRFIDDEDNDEIWYKVQVQVNKATAGDWCYGLQLIVTANAPFGYTKEIERKITGLTDMDTFEVPVVTDEYGIFYPDVHISLGNNGLLFLLENRTVYDYGYGYQTGSTTHMSNCEVGEQIDFYGTGVMQFTSTNTTHNYENDFNYKFPILIAEPGLTSNEFIIRGMNNFYCDITFKYRGIRKVGFD